MYIRRQIEDNILKVFDVSSKAGLIVSGIVGCGKTTLIEKCIEQLGKKFEVFKFTGDDVKFRSAIIEDTAYIYNHIASLTQKPSLVFREV